MSVATVTNIRYGWSQGAVGCRGWGKSLRGNWQNSRRDGGTVRICEKKVIVVATHSENFPSFGQMGHVKEKAKKESRRKMLTWGEPGDVAMIVHYWIQLKAGTMQCWTETKEWNIENDKKRAKSRKTKPKKKETKENLEVHIEEELGPVQWEIRRIEIREEKISLRWVCL